MKTIELAFTYTEAVAVQASFELSKSTGKSLTVMPWLGAALVILSLAAPLLFPVGFTDLLIPLIFGISFLVIRFTVARKIRRNFKDNPNSNKVIRYWIDEHGVRIDSTGSSTRYDWDRLLKVVEREAGFLLFVHRRIAHWMPKAAFEDRRDIAEFRNLIRSRGVTVTS
jgi:hypothetical protein